MEPVSNLVKVSLANYLANLPLPNSILGWFRIGIGGWIRLIPFFSAVGGISFVTYRFVYPKSPCNPGILKDKPKVGDCFDIEELGERTSFCRCWRSAKWPYCDGAHKYYNKATGDNTGPVVITKKKPDAEKTS